MVAGSAILRMHSLCGGDGEFVAISRRPLIELDVHPLTTDQAE